MLSSDQIEIGKCYIGKANGKDVVVKVVDILGNTVKTEVRAGDPPGPVLEQHVHKNRAVVWVSRPVIPPGRQWSQPQRTPMRQFIQGVEKEVPCEGAT